MTTRRGFLKAVGGAGAASLLPGCGNDELAVPDLPEDFDYPTVSPAPFCHGVASGDPLEDRVIIWTRITQPGAGTVSVDWVVARDPGLLDIVRSGRQQALARRDWTLKVDVTGLQPATTYYYGFSSGGAHSLTGRTRTAPAAHQQAEQLRFAVVACSSYWSSHWSGYGHLARRNDLDLVLHCGDYIYDFVDQDEQVRARRDRFDTADVDYRDWLNLDEVRRRYALYRSDANLCRAHQQHPWMIVWDNHDIDPGYGNELPTPFDGTRGDTTLDDTCRAFWEWTPSRPVRADGSGAFILMENGEYPEPENVRLLYRRLPYGQLAEFFGVDTQIGLPRYDQSPDTAHLPADAPSLYGTPQFNWLTAGLLDAQQRNVQWKVLNNQTWMTPVDIPSIVEGISLPKLGLSRWADYPEERRALCDFLAGGNAAAQRIHGTVLVSGDAHGNLGADLVGSDALLSPYLSGLPLPSLRGGSTPENRLAGFVRAGTGNLGPLNARRDSVGVEFAPSSMGRGGADEIFANALPQNPQALNVAGARVLELLIATANKNVQFIEWVDHGYGIVDLTPERAIFEYWWQDKLTPDSPDVLGMQMVSWAEEDPLALPSPRYRDQIDAVSLHGMAVTPTVGAYQSLPAPDGVLQPD